MENNLNVFLKRFGERNDTVYDAYEIYDELKTFLDEKPNYILFKNVVCSLTKLYGCKIDNLNDLINLKFSNELNAESKSKKSAVKSKKRSNGELLKLYKLNNDIEARDELIINNIGLVKKSASRRVKLPTSFTFEDLVQEGIIGMIRGIEKFDISMENTFSTYVCYWIDQAIDRAIADRGYTVRLPAHLYEKISKLARIENNYYIYGEEIDENTICEELNISSDQYNKLKFYKKNYYALTSLNATIGPTEGDQDSELQDFIPMEESANVEESVIEEDLRKIINEVLKSLTPKEERILRLRFGLDDGKERTLEDVGRIFNVTRERIRQIESKTLRKLRHPSRAKYLRDYTI